ncbi:DUF397 domain-containing protein [Actinomadura sp. 1N219]|uniref:DUF397 domain-containing protein n=1 Tax=Actinomadura sp. 1N219 TaxID=3375152 RepID=UPI0037A9B21C
MSVVNLSSCIWRKSSHSDSSGAECVEVASIPVNWQKSSYSTDTGHQCVEVAPMVPVSSAEWMKSSRSDNTGGACVEVADLAAAVAVRDSKDPDGAKLVFGPAAWQAFASKVKSGTLDLA